MDGDDALFAATRERFELPEGLIYLDGNSLGPLPAHAAERVRRTLEAEWGERLIGGWNEAGWMAMPLGLGDRIAPLIGAASGTVVVGDTLSVRVHQLLDAALALRPDRPVVLTDTGNFPSDRYVAEALVARLGGGRRLEAVAPEAIEERLADDVAVLMLTHVDYRSGRMHPMGRLTGAAHAVGALALWDLAHSAGAVPLALEADAVDLAAGCTYKYLNGGPGAPAFAYVAPALVGAVEPALVGWLGHAEPFAFEPRYRPARGIARLRVGTPPVVALAALDAALDVWDEVPIERVRARSTLLTERFREALARDCPALALASPLDPAARGSQLSFRCTDPAIDAYALMQSLIHDHRVVGDFRAPDLLRFGFAPLYLAPEQVDRAAAALAEVIDGRGWDTPRHRRRRAVT